MVVASGFLLVFPGQVLFVYFLGHLISVERLPVSRFTFEVLCFSDLFEDLAISFNLEMHQLT